MVDGNPNDDGMDNGIMDIDFEQDDPNDSGTFRLDGIHSEIV